MGRGRTVKAPDGGVWVVRRRYLDPPRESRRRLPFRRIGVSEEDVPDSILQAVLGDWPNLGVLGLLLIVIFIVLPLLGIALELIVLIFILCSGVFARVVLGRPWIVEAVPRSGGERRAVRFPVKGWRRAGEVAEELAREVAATGRPDAFEVPGG
jgi:hypothetical protein